MARKQTKVENYTVKPVDTIQFTKQEDGDLLQLINNYTAAFNKYVMTKMPARNAIRNLLMKTLPRETDEIISNDSKEIS